MWAFLYFATTSSNRRCQIFGAHTKWFPSSNEILHRTTLSARKALTYVTFGLPSPRVGPVLRSFGHQGALYYVFLASDPLKTSREYAVFTLRTRGPKVCTRETSRQTQRVSAFFVLIAPNDRITSYIAGYWRPEQNFMMFQRTKNERFSKNGNIKNLVQKTKMGP